ncbi:unnamed protein product [Didymodactylos carnosus]|uniref:Uncharacterized protein n=1 Tax=Didymodactylos carnosus TaxID=1234261 RepID=A0A813QLY3_9BILA|nr:unnamed protein product [Didymodactylos carnosus]CAF3551683.1 unnamed protein product [Didymodactylos carnosus]
MPWIGLISSVGCAAILLYLLKKCLKQKLVIRSKTVLITGSSSGLGEALARRFFSEQCQLILVARRLDRLEKLRNELMASEPSYPKPHLIQLDLCELSTLNDKLKNIGSVDILINNAGQSQRGSVIETKFDIDTQIINLNYLSLVALTKIVLSSMTERRTGCIVNISSLQGLIAVPERSTYSASKHAVQAFSDSLRMELAELGLNDIHICVISPSYIKTELAQQASSAANKTSNNMSSAYEPSYVAERILKAIQYKETDVLICPFHQRLVIWLRFFWPYLFFRLMIIRNKRLKSRQSNR